MPWVVDTFPAMGMFWPLEALDLKACPPSQGVTPKPWALEVATRYIQGPSGRFFFQYWAGLGGELKKTLPKALRTQVLTALTSNFGLVGLVQYAW